MHELAIARNIHATVLREMEDRRLPGINRIGLSIGSLSGIVPDALEFGFNAVKEGTPLSGTVLDIKSCPGHGSCTQCYAEFDMDDFSFTCPQCGSVDVRIDQGRELDITWLEVQQ